VQESDSRLAKPIEPYKETAMWTKPEVTEMRFGFEVTMYVCNR
jgi:pyrroloquinoline quinone biosynthesis protein A